MLQLILRGLDWFIPAEIRESKTDLPVWRNFVFTHIAGPLASQAISVYLWEADQSHGFACWTMTISILAFLALPFVLKFSRSLAVAALLSVQLLAFASLFGAFNYGGDSSPFLPWLLVAVLLGYFYISDRPRLVTAVVSANIACFAAAYFTLGFPNLVSPEELSHVGWISVTGGIIYMSWMANFYANLMSKRSELELETVRHRNTAEELRSASEAAERASRGKSTFLARMSHELRTPLNAVIGYSELLMEDLADDAADGSKRSDLMRINNAGKHLLSLVTDVLDLAKIESDEIELRVERFALEPLLEEIVGTSMALAKIKKNRLMLHTSGAMGDMDSDAVKLRQILLNLIGNAAKFTSNGTINLSARQLSGNDGDWIEFSVADNGIGISKAEQSRLFEKFSQASVDTAKLFGGSGLGLAICARLSALMGGTIAVESELGKGARFTVILPTSAPHQTLKQAA